MSENDFQLKVVERLSSIEAHLGHYNASLDEHMKRTEMLEERFEPIEKHVQEVSGALKFVKFVVWILASVGTILSIVKLFGGMK